MRNDYFIYESVYIENEKSECIGKRDILKNVIYSLRPAIEDLLVLCTLIKE